MKKKRTYPAAVARRNQEQVLLLEQLKKTPIVQIACDKVSVARASFYRWKKEDPAFAHAADEALLEGILLMNDMAESQLLSAIRDNNMTAIMFWLRSRHPGYGNKMELKATVERKDRTLTPEERAIIRRALKLGGFS
jgi:predicted DNA binding protein